MAFNLFDFSNLGGNQINKAISNQKLPTVAPYNPGVQPTYSPVRKQTVGGEMQFNIPQNQKNTQNTLINPDVKGFMKLGQMVKAKYPEYNDLTDEELGRKMLAKYPEYNDIVMGEDLGFLGGAKELATGAFRAGEQIPSIVGKGLGFVGETIGTGLDYITPGLGKGAKDLGQRFQNIGEEITQAGMTDGGTNQLTQNQKEMRQLGGQLALTAPVGGGYIAGGKTALGVAGRSGIVGAGFGATDPIINKGNEATFGDIVTGGAIGGTLGAAIPLAGAGVVKGIKGAGKYISKTLPENLQVSSQFNRADLTNVSERLAKLTGKDVEVEDAARWLLDRGVKGDLKTQRQQIQAIIAKEEENASKILSSKLGDIGETKEANNLRKALSEKLDNYLDKDGIPTAGNEDIVAKIRSIISNKSMTLQEMNNGRKILADGLFTKQGTMKELASKEGWQNVWKDTSKFIESKAPGFRATNKNIEVGIAIDNAMLKKETAEQTRAMLAYLGFGGSIGSAGGYAMGGDLESAVKGAAIGFGVGQISRILNSPKVKSTLAYYLNKLSPEARSTIKNLQKGVEVKVENIGKVVEEIKMLPPPSGKPLSAKVVNVKPIELPSKLQQNDITKKSVIKRPSGEVKTVTPKTIKKPSTTIKKNENKSEIKKPSTSTTSREIPEGYIENPLTGEIIKKPKGMNSGFLKIGVPEKKIVKPDIDNALIEEARKYKSVEEFIKAKLPEYKKFENDTEFTKYHITGIIPNSTYSEYGVKGGLDFFGKTEKNPFLIKTIKVGDENISFRKRNSKDTAISVINSKNEVIGGASNEFGADGVWIINDYQGKGIGTKLLREFRKQYSPDRKIGQATEGGYMLAKKYYRELEKEATKLKQIYEQSKKSPI